METNEGKREFEAEKTITFYNVLKGYIMELDMRYVENLDSLLIFYDCNYCNYYGYPSNNCHYIIYKDCDDDRIVGIEIFNFFRIAESEKQITDIEIKYYKEIDLLEIFDDRNSGNNNIYCEVFDDFRIWYREKHDVVGIEIFHFKEKMRRF